MHRTYDLVSQNQMEAIARTTSTSVRKEEEIDAEDVPTTPVYSEGHLMPHDVVRIFVFLTRMYYVEEFTC